jgi:hypothetical protein
MRQLDALPDVVGSSLAASRPPSCFLARFSIIVTTSISNFPFYLNPQLHMFRLVVDLSMADLPPDCSHERPPSITQPAITVER